MTAPAAVMADVSIADLRAALRTERDAIERRHYADLLRLAEIREQLAALTDGPVDG